MSMPFFSNSRSAYHGGYKTAAMLCSSGAQNNWQCKLTAVIRRQPCSEAVAAHCGDQTTAMLCSSGSKAQATAMLCSSGSKALTLVSPMQAMLSSNDSSKLTLVVFCMLCLLGCFVKELTCSVCNELT